MPEFQEEASDWQIDTIPVRLQNRKLDLGDISPCRTELLIDSMKSSVQGIQVTKLLFVIEIFQSSS